MKEKNTIDMARRVLSELSEMAEHASMTGSLRGGERTAAQGYNRVLDTLEDEDRVPDGMFERLEVEQADYGQIGVQCRLLLSVLGSEKEEERQEDGLGAVIALAPFLKSEDLAQLVRERMGDGIRVSDGLLTGLAPFLGSEMLGDLVRRNLRRPSPPEPPQPPKAPEPSRPPQPHDLVRREESEDRRSEIRRRLDELERPTPADSVSSATLESLAEELRQPDLSAEDRQRIATRLAELAYAQSVHAIE